MGTVPQVSPVQFTSEWHENEYSAHVSVSMDRKEAQEEEESRAFFSSAAAECISQLTAQSLDVWILGTLVALQTS